MILHQSENFLLHQSENMNEGSFLETTVISLYHFSTSLHCLHSTAFLSHCHISPWWRVPLQNVSYQFILFQQFATLTFASIDNTLSTQHTIFISMFYQQREIQGRDKNAKKNLAMFRTYICTSFIFSTIEESEFP